MIDGGFAVRRVAAAPLDEAFRGVREVCSVSTCISEGPEQWINTWLHNDFGWFNAPSDALQMVPEESVHRLFAYRVHDEMFRKGEVLTIERPANVAPEPMPATFRTIGFDAVSRSPSTSRGFDCSPLSCNSMAAERSANEHCLFATLDAALDSARQFSIDQPEPGDYYVIEVLEGRVEYAEPPAEDFAGAELRPGETNAIDEYKEWAAHRYDPGHYLGGTIEPHLRMYALGPNARRAAAAYIGIPVVFGVGALAVALFTGDSTSRPMDWIGVGAFMVLWGAAAWKLFSSSKRL